MLDGLGCCRQSSSCALIIVRLKACEKEHIELEIEMVPVMQRRHAALLPQLLCVLVLLVVELFTGKVL